MKLSEYLSIERGRGAYIASVLNVAPQQVYQWASGSRGVPLERCVEIENATGGEVTRKDLRPDDWEKMWPELVEPPRRIGERRTHPGRRKEDKQIP